MELRTFVCHHAGLWHGGISVCVAKNEGLAKRKFKRLLKSYTKFQQHPHLIHEDDLYDFDIEEIKDGPAIMLDDGDE